MRFVSSILRVSGRDEAISSARASSATPIEEFARDELSLFSRETRGRREPNSRKKYIPVSRRKKRMPLTV